MKSLAPLMLNGEAFHYFRSMETFDQRVDIYIDNAAEFAKPILKHLRQLVHTACPEITETIKWSFPCFDYKGIVCSMAAFKHHCTFGFWKTSILPDPNKILETGSAKESMGALGRLKNLTDLPKDNILIRYIQNAVFLNETGVKLPKKPSTSPKTELLIPSYFIGALAAHPLAKITFDEFSYSHKKEYLEWITEAKTEETRQTRIKTALEWLSEGKSRNWKYLKK